MYKATVIFILFSVVLCEQAKFKTVVLEQGVVSGEKYWNGDFYEFYGIPYAKVPTDRDRFKAPLPVVPWEGVYPANQNQIACHQTYYTGEETDKIYLAGEEECLVLNLLVPEIASETNLLPVLVYIHSGAFAAGSANMAKMHHLAKHDVIVVSFNFRLGAIGFACLGTEDIPGNAGMKDSVAALKWINKNIKSFGGNPNKVTLAGFSVGAAMAELLLLSKTTEGLIDKLVLESGSALSPFAVNRDPISTAENIAKSFGYTGSDVKSLSEFYLNSTSDVLAAKSLNFFLTNSTFGFAPCIESEHSPEPFLTESPLKIMQRGDYPKVPVLTGYANMEGISRALKFNEWSELMNEKFEDFLPADLKFTDKSAEKDTVKKIKDFYFKGEEVTHDTLMPYIDYFSDSMFKYSISKSAKLHAASSGRPIFFYEFAYVGGLSMKHQYMDRIKGASHRDQTSYLLDFFGWTNGYDDLDMIERMTSMWTDFVKYENPVEYESPVISYEWPAYTKEKENYLQINVNPKIKVGLVSDAYKFWDKLYKEYYWNPSPVKDSKK